MYSGTRHITNRILNSFVISLIEIDILTIKEKLLPQKNFFYKRKCVKVIKVKCRINYVKIDEILILQNIKYKCTYKSNSLQIALHNSK